MEKVDPDRGETPLFLPSQLSEEETIDAIACLLSAQGNTKPARFSGARRPDISQVLPSASIELAALYYITYIYRQEWKHAAGVAVWNKDSEINPRGGITKAYEGYRRWFVTVKALGLSHARAKRLDPLDGTGLRWYGN